MVLVFGCHSHMGKKKELVVANWQRKAITVASKAIKAGQGQDYRRQEERRGVPPPPQGHRLSEAHQ